ncbi:Anaerobic glycerol-3-phosphate dehydrogenase subunit A [Neomoorella glycerini]|uniref:Anaerobic glycerol-3-phosphate dehydrogenase subunit A n=1 Tax=Neomoorella glycerini TaxID=55779 RepID=A0A6I5ZME7_9FIRM|nr:FAD-dependent oxidoreductase [Moorella glycerini]QGP91054.1 Anaerobic glycerol-3-phosphate dehydrogenase subunit A [Moorella glycerini]
MQDDFQVVIIGGGATGTGILRDLALRGVSCLLVEKDGLASGTSGRFHGLLHSGARYAVNDPHAAAECARENAILKRVAGEFIADTGGYFVATPEDDDDYIATWTARCQAAGISIKEVPVKEALKKEPLLNPEIKRVFLVPDAAIDGFKLVEANARSAARLEAKVKTYTLVTGLELKNGSVRGVYLKNQVTGQEEFVACQVVVNAAGSWAGCIAAMAGIKLNIIHDKGALLVFSHRLCGRVINRLRPPGDGDIFVPHGNVTIFGTTSVIVPSPDDHQVTLREVSKLLDEGARIFPGLRERRLIRAFAGVRPIYQGDAGETGRQATRDFSVIDHEQVDGVHGLISAAGGKLTTFRLMAQVAADMACKKLGIERNCMTDVIPYDADAIKARQKSYSFLCQCEMVTAEMLTEAVKEKAYFTFNDVRRLTRLGMGPCQGTFCTFKAAGYYHGNATVTAAKAARLLKEHIQERWKGNRFVLWGDQAQEMEITRGIYLGTLNLAKLESENNAV